MRLSIKQKQVLGVTAMVAIIVTALSLLHLVNLAHALLEESRARAELLANAVYLQARDVVTDRADRLRRAALQPQRAVGPRGRHLLAGRDRRGDRRSGGRRDRVERSGAGRRHLAAAHAAQQHPRRERLRPGPVHLRDGAGARMDPADRARRSAVRRNPHRLLDAAGPPRPESIAGAGGAGGGRVAAGRRAGRPCCWRRSCCARST